MKAIFTGTEQDLIECGFRKCSHKYIESCYAFADFLNGDSVIILKNNRSAVAL